jgi:hypothetical protein
MKLDYSILKDPSHCAQSEQVVELAPLYGAHSSRGMETYSAKNPSRTGQPPSQPSVSQLQSRINYGEN